jgi:tetratricopeptide (TPR) repeat protein
VNAPPKKKTGWSRRRKALVLVVLVLGLVGAAVSVALIRGRRREGLYEKAVQALAAGDRKTAEAHFRTVLATTPENAAARARLLQMYMEDARYDEAEGLAREWTKRGPEPVWGWKHLVEIAIRRQRLDEAEAIARTIAETDPVFAQMTIVRLRDVRGTFWDRAQSADAAVNLSTLTPDRTVKAELLLYAAETLLDLQSQAPEPARPSLEARARRYLAQATAALEGSSAAGKSLRDLTARIQLFSTSESEASLAARTLASSLEEDPAGHEARASLAWYHTRRKEWEPAAKLIRALKDAPLLVWLRAVRRWDQAGGDRARLLDFLDAAPTTAHPLIALLRASALLRGDEAQRAEATALLQKLAQEAKSEPGLAIEAYRLLSRAGTDPAGVQLLEDVAGANADLRQEALLSSLLAGTPEARERALRHIEGLSARVSSRGEAVEVLELVRRGGREAVERYLARDLDVRTEEGARLRLHRATAAGALSLRDSKAEDAGLLREAALRDLEALRTSALSKVDLNAAWPLALVFERRNLAGALAARAISIEGPPDNVAFGVFLLGSKTANDAHRAEVAEGLAEGAREGGPAAFLRLFADAVRRKDEPARVLEALVPLFEDPASQVPALFLSVRLANLQKDLARAERDARRLVDLRPGSLEAKELLGDLLLRRKAYDEVVALHPAPSGPSLHGYRQRAVALWELGRKEEALAAARAAVREVPLDAAAHFLLAQIHLRSGNKEEALRTLTVAPVTRDVAVLRGQLLAEKGETLVAEMLFSTVLLARPDDVDAWRGLSSVMALQGRHEEVVTALTGRIERKDAPLPPEPRAEMVILRGMALEQLGRVDEALRDYEDGLRTFPDSVVALNNTTWLLLRHRKDRLGEAKGYIERALKVAPNHPSVLDTAATLHFEAKEYDRALEYSDQAIAAAPKPSYKLLRLRILHAAGRLEDAKKQLEDLEKTARDSREAREGAEILRSKG